MHKYLNTQHVNNYNNTNKLIHRSVLVRYSSHYTLGERERVIEERRMQYLLVAIERGLGRRWKSLPAGYPYLARCGNRLTPLRSSAGQGRPVSRLRRALVPAAATYVRTHAFVRPLSRCEVSPRAACSAARRAARRLLLPGLGELQPRLALNPLHSGMRAQARLPAPRFDCSRRL